MKLFRKRNRKRHGFTLIEILVSISILAVISSVGLVTYSHSQQASLDSKRRQDLIEIKNALIIYNQFNKNQTCNYPCGMAFSDNSTWSTLENGSSGSPPYSGMVPNFIASLPSDPTNSSPYIYVFHGGNICGTLQNKLPTDSSCPIPLVCNDPPATSPLCNFGYSAK